MTTQQIFNAAYKASLKPSVAALFDLQAGDPVRGEMALQLAQSGEIIDGPIMVWNWDPYTTMLVRQTDGYTWVPSYLQPPVMVAPGLTYPGLPSYDPNDPPVGSIKVSTNPADFKPYGGSTPPAPVLSYVGQFMYENASGQNVYSFGTKIAFPTATESVANGETLTEAGHTYLVNISQGVFGLTIQSLTQLS